MTTTLKKNDTFSAQLDLPPPYGGPPPPPPAPPPPPDPDPGSAGPLGAHAAFLVTHCFFPGPFATRGVSSEPPGDPTPARRPRDPPRTPPAGPHRKVDGGSREIASSSCTAPEA